METVEVNIIKQLIDMDKRARKMVENAEQEKRKAELDLVSQKTQVELEIMAKAQNRIQRMKSQSTNETVKETTSIEDEGKQMMQRLETVFNENHQKWEDDLFARCINVSW